MDLDRKKKDLDLTHVQGATRKDADEDLVRELQEERAGRLAAACEACLGFDMFYR